MTDESPRRDSGSKWGRAWNFVAPMGLWRIGRDTVQSVRETFSRSSTTLRSVNQIHFGLSDWNSTIARLGVDEARIRREVTRRQVMAGIAAMFFCIGIYGLFAWSALLPGVGCAAMATLYYFQSTLRLFQIRHRKFTSIAGFISQVRLAPREFLPLGLPDGWKLFIREGK
jgi:hypothetical protein